MSRTATPRPFVKWAGGKTQIARKLIETLEDSPGFDNGFENYFEPFVGGGALFFALYRAQKVRRAFLSDLNQELIETYRVIRDNVGPLIKVLQQYPHDRAFFYKIRAVDPEELDPMQRAARMIYLNRTCYNGLYRVNREGKFNVPFGSYKSPTICDEKNLRAVSQALKKVEIACQSFETVLERAKKGDFVYFDPPYEPLSKTANFTSYQPTGFNREAQEKLRDVCHELTKRKVLFMLSNSSADLIHNLYSKNGFHIHQVDAIRAINSNPERRGKLKELIVTNFPTPDGKVSS